MKFQAVVLATALLAGLGNAAATPANTAGSQEAVDLSNTPMDSTVAVDGGNEDVAGSYLPNFEVTTFSGKNCNGHNQGTTRVDQSTRACIESSNAGSYHLTSLTNGFHSYPPCKKVEVHLKNKFQCGGKPYFHAIQDTDKCYHFYGPASHKSFYAKCVGT